MKKGGRSNTAFFWVMKICATHPLEETAGDLLSMTFKE